MRISDWSSDVCSADLNKRFLTLDQAATIVANPLHPIRAHTHQKIESIHRRALHLSSVRSLALCAMTAAFSLSNRSSDRKSDVYVKSVSVRVDLGGRRRIYKKNKTRSRRAHLVN